LLGTVSSASRHVDKDNERYVFNRFNAVYTYYN